MSFILLTGAGFSRNWGGGLSDEAMEYLLADKSLTTPMRAQLWADKSLNRNFEDSIQAFRDAAVRYNDAFHEQQLRTFMGIVSGMFNAIRNSFTMRDFEFEDSRRNVTRFLQMFDAIYTLNQDTLLEHHYFRDDFAAGAPASKWEDAEA